jgi:hypothetical protein
VCSGDIKERLIFLFETTRELDGQPVGKRFSIGAEFKRLFKVIGEFFVMDKKRCGLLRDFKFVEIAKVPVTGKFR